DVSINSKGIKPKVSVAGFSKNIHSAGFVNTNKSSSSFSIPTPYGIISAGRSYVRQWINETTDVATNGALYYPQTNQPYTYFDNRAFDTYDMYVGSNSVHSETDAEKNLHGSFPDYDHFMVNAQGLSGTIRPYHYYGYLS